MDISEAIYRRQSIRAFKSDPVPRDTLKQILEESLRAPSWANTQPWEFAIATGKPLEEIRAGFLEKRMTSPSPDAARPPEFPERYAARIRVLDRQNRLVTKKDWESREAHNFRHFGAPAVIYLLTRREFYYQTKGLNVWALYDCGAVVQNILLLATRCGGKFIQALHAAFLIASLDLLEGDTGHIGIRLNFFPVRPRTLTATVFRLVNQHEAEVVLGILTGANNIDGEIVFSGSGKYIYATTLQRRTRKLRMAAAFFESAGLAETAGTSAHTESFIKSLQKKLFLQSDRNFFRFAATRFE
jgi:nitroreductase